DRDRPHATFFGHAAQRSDASEPSMSRFVFAVLITCALSACGPRGLRWDYTIPSTLEGSPMRAAVRDGGCEGAVRWETDFVDGATSSAPPTLPAGTYGVEL